VEYAVLTARGRRRRGVVLCSSYAVMEQARSVMSCSNFPTEAPAASAAAGAAAVALCLYDKSIIGKSSTMLLPAWSHTVAHQRRIQGVTGVTSHPPPREKKIHITKMK